MPRNWDEYHQSEKPALELLDKLGYKVYDQEEEDCDSLPSRDSEHEVVLKTELKAALKRINDWDINDNNIQKANK